MRGILRPAALAAVGVAFLSLASCNKGTTTTETTTAPAPEAAAATETMAPATPVVDVAAEQAAITNLAASFGTLVANKDANGAAALYADDAGLYPPGMPAQLGHEAILSTWQGFVGTPGMALETHTTNVTIASSGDLAVETGTYTQKTGDTAAPTVVNGKYVTSWVKRDGQWKILADIFNEDGPAAAAPATPDSAMTAPTDSMAPAMAPTTPAPTAPAPTEQ